jgi:hypothetical protein
VIWARAVPYVASRRVVDLLVGLADQSPQRQWEVEAAAVIFPSSRETLVVFVADGGNIAGNHPSQRDQNATHF